MGHTIADQFAETTGAYKARYDNLVNYLMSLGDDVRVKHLQVYDAYKRVRNFACILPPRRKEVIILSVHLDPGQIDLEEGFTRDMSKGSPHEGRHGSGNLEITIDSDESLERAKPLLRKAYNEETRFR